MFLEPELDKIDPYKCEFRFEYLFYFSYLIII